MGLPLNVVADNSSFPELFELPPPAARAVARDAHPVAQPAGDLRRAAPPRAARPAGRLGLPQRRDPGPAVRCLDDAAGRSGDARRQDVVADPAGDHRPPARRPAAGHVRRADLGRARTTRPTSSARPRRSPTPSPHPIRPAPEQWYSFKPIWPASAAEARRPRATGAARCRPAGPTRARRAACRATRRTRSSARPRRSSRRMTFRGRLLLAMPHGSPAGCPERPALPARGPRSATCGTGWPPTARPRRGATSRRVCQSLAASGEGSPRGPGRRDRPDGPRAAGPLRVPASRPLLPRGRARSRASRPPTSTSGSRWTRRS